MHYVLVDPSKMASSELSLARQSMYSALSATVQAYTAKLKPRLILLIKKKNLTNPLYFLVCVVTTHGMGSMF